jgi:tRNA (guanine-N7-)-methyltransferase
MTDHRRPIRSFVRRSGRLTHAQQRALGSLLPRWEIRAPAPGHVLDLDEYFGRDAPRVLEIGFGDGEALAETAAATPGTDFLGIEVHEPGVGHLLLAVEREGLTNVRVIVHDAVEVLADWLAPASLDRIRLFFPDPWPKKRHHKRRIVQPGFLADAGRALRPGGTLHMATDWAPYAEHMRETADAAPWFDRTSVAPGSGNEAGPGGDRGPERRPETKFERRGRRLGHGVADLLYTRNDRPVTLPPSRP